MRHHEREDVILSKTRKMVRDGVPDPALVLQYEKLAREARMPCGTFIESGNRVRKPPTRLQEKENNLRLANMSHSKKMAHEVSKLRSLCEDWKKEALALRAKIEDVDRKASTPNSTPSSSRSTKTRYPSDSAEARRKRKRLSRAIGANKLKLSAEAEAEINLCTKFLCKISYEDLRVLRRGVNRSLGKKKARRMGLATEANLKGAVRIAKAEVVQRGLKILGSLEGVDDTSEGLIRDPRHVLEQILDLHVSNLSCKYLNKDCLLFDYNGDLKEIKIGVRVGTDGFPLVSTQPSFTQASVSFSCFQHNSIFFTRVLMYSAHPENHPATIKGLHYIFDSFNEMLTDSAANRLTWNGVKVTLVGVMPTVDWAMACKLINCHGASSLMVGYMLKISRDDWEEKLAGASDEDIQRLTITPEMRKQMGEDIKQYMDDWDTKWRAANPQAPAKIFEQQQREELKAKCFMTRNPQKGLPFSLWQDFIHCVLHGKIRIASRQAKCFAFLDPDISASFAAYAELKTLSRDLLKITDKKGSSVNLNGRQASLFFRKIPEIISARMEGKRNVKELLFVVHLMICCSIRDIIGRVMITSDWKSTDVTAIARMGRRCMNLVLAIFGKNRVQPYVYAMLIELPVQLKLYQSRCQDLGIPADTTALNAQNSEHVNKIMKDIEHSMSSHNKVVAHDSPDVGDHTESRMFLIFLHEHITKRKAFTHDLLTYKLLRTCNTDANHILPDQKVCNVCGHARESATHKSICEHVWMPELEAIMESGKLTDDLKEYLSSDEALTMLSYHNLGGNVAQCPRQRLRKVTSTTCS
ncbi:hypothetical protein AAMO2058_001120500 [Amorphochlora amoebiformis]